MCDHCCIYYGRHTYGYSHSSSSGGNVCPRRLVTPTPIANVNQRSLDCVILKTFTVTEVEASTYHDLSAFYHSPLKTTAAGPR